MKSKIDNNLRNAKNIGATIEKYLNIPSELKKELKDKIQD